MLDALDDIGNAEITVVLAGESVLLTQVDLPPIRQGARRLQAARYALEEQVAGSVDHLHFSMGPRQSSGATPVAVVDDELLNNTLASLGPARKQVSAIVVDMLCLPLPDAESYTLHLIGERALLRQGLYQGFASEIDLLPTLLSNEQAQEVQLQVQAQNHPGHQTVLDALAHEGHVLVRASEYDDYGWLTDVTAHSGINLMQAAFAATSGMNDAWLPLRATACLACFWLVLALATQSVQYFQLSDRISELEQQSEVTFRKAFPQVQTINDIRVQGEQNLRALRGGGGASGIFPLLGATAIATDSASGLEVQSLQFRDGALTLSLRGKDIQSLEGLRDSFSKQPNAELEVESADAASEGVQIRARVTGAGA